MLLVISGIYASELTCNPVNDQAAALILLFAVNTLSANYQFESYVLGKAAI